MTNPPLDIPAVRGLRDLYASLPTLDCKRLCSHSCLTVIDMSTTERVRVERVRGAELPLWMSSLYDQPCPLLDGPDCSVYGVRPMICRLWGLSDSMRCPHGCVPSSGAWFDDHETLDLLLRSFEVGGRQEDLSVIRQVFDATPDQKPLYKRLLAREASAGAELAALARRRGAAPDGR